MTAVHLCVYIFHSGIQWVSAYALRHSSCTCWFVSSFASRLVGCASCLCSECYWVKVCSVVIAVNSSGTSHYSSHRTGSDSATRRPAHGAGARHEVVLKPLPFYDVLAEIMKPSSLGMSKQMSVFMCSFLLNWSRFQSSLYTVSQKTLTFLFF